MDQLKAISAKIPLALPYQLIIVASMSALLLYLRPFLFLILAGAGAFFFLRSRKSIDDTKKKDDGDTPADKKAHLQDNDDEMKHIMKDMKRDQKRRRESDKEALNKELEEEERRKKEEEQKRQAEELRKKEEKRKEMRSNVAKELFETEKSYVDKLNTLVEVFKQPMGHSAAITADQINKIFSNVETLRNFNVLLLQDLEKIMSSWTDDSQLGSVFLRMADFLKLYIIFINNYSQSLETVNHCKQHPQFCTLLEACERNPRCSALDLPSLLIMPVQRIPRYILLLTEIYKHTPSTHPDYAKLGQALTKVKEVAVHINEAKREAELELRLYDLSKSIDHLTEPLIRPARKLILEGELKQKPKAASLSDAWELVTLFLFNDVLIQTKKKSKRYATKSISPLSSLQIVRYDNKNEFGMIINGVFMTLTGTNEETTKWVNTIVETQKAYIEGSKSLEGSPKQRLAE